MKRSGLLAALLLGALGLIGCGDGGLQSPDFTPVLTGVSLGSDGAVDPSAPAGTDQRVLAAGQSASLVALGTFTTPPGFTDASGAPASTQDKLLGDAGFSLTPDGIATVSNGQITGNTVGGIVTVTAVKDGISSNPISFRVAPPVLVSLDVTPDTITISPLETATFSATGTFSDGTVAPVVVDWTVAPGGVVTLSNSNAQNTVATSSPPLVPLPTAPIREQAICLTASWTGPAVSRPLRRLTLMVLQRGRHRADSRLRSPLR